MNKSSLLSINKHFYSKLKDCSPFAFVAGIIKTSCKSFEMTDSQLRTDFDSKYFTMSDKAISSSFLSLTKFTECACS